MKQRVYIVLERLGIYDVDHEIKMVFSEESLADEYINTKGKGNSWKYEIQEFDVYTHL